MTKIKVRCSKCKNTMLYESMDGKISGKVKRCVYCGFSMQVRKAMM